MVGRVGEASDGLAVVLAEDPGLTVALGLRASRQGREVSGLWPQWLIQSSSDPFVHDNGLFLARELAELHGGTVRAQRDDEHGYDTFVVHLPLAPENGTAS